MRDRRGFTLVELITVVIVLGVLGGIAVMRYLDLQNDALAGKVASDMEGIRLAAIAYHADTEVWPPPSGAGVTPPALAPLLPGNLEWGTEQYTYAWLNEGGDLVGVHIVGLREGLTAKLRARLVFGSPFAPYGDDIIYIIKSPGISM